MSTTTTEITIPYFNWSATYYPEVLEALIEFKRTNVPELTDESPQEPLTQLLRAWACCTHLSNTLIDVVANEATLPTAQLPETVRNMLRLIDYEMSGATPATAEVVYELSQPLSVTTEVIPAFAACETEATEERPAIPFEAIDALSVTRTDQLTAAFTDEGGTWAEVTDEANDSTPGSTFRTWGVPSEADALYIGHAEIMWDAVDITMSTPGAGIVGVWEYYDGNTRKVAPTSVSDQSTFLRVDLTSYLGTENRAGTKIRVHLLSTGAYEDVTSVYVGGVNRADTTGLLGQSPVSTTAAHYLVGSEWEILDDITDETDGLNGAGNVAYTLPQTVDRSWEKTTIQSVEGFWLRFRVTTRTTTLTIAGADANGGVTYTNAQPGENVRVRHVISGNNTALAVSVSGLDVTVTVATNGSGAATSTATQVVAALGGVAAYVTAVVTGTGAGIVGAAGFTQVPPVAPVIDQIRIDAGKQYVIRTVTQGRRQTDDPVGSSDGTADQEFTTSRDSFIDESETVTVDGVPWLRVSDFLSSKGTDRHYVIQKGADDRASILFGDGITGAIPTTGVGNIAAVYRYDVADDGNVGSNTIVVDKAGLSFISRLYNPRTAAGWQEAEAADEDSLERAKMAGPASLRTKEVALGPDDVVDMTLAYKNSVGVKPFARALAVEELNGPKTIGEFVVGTGGAQVSADVLDELATYFNGDITIEPPARKHVVANQQVVPTNYIPRVVDVTVTVQGTTTAAKVKAALDKLLKPLALASDGVTFQWKWGGRVPISRLIHECFAADSAGKVLDADVTLPAADIQLLQGELPVAGTITVTVTA